MVVGAIPGKPQVLLWEDPADVSLPILLPIPALQHVAGQGAELREDGGVLYVGELAGGGHDLGRRVGVAGIHPVTDHPADAGLFGVTGNAASLAVEDLRKNLHIKPVVIHNAGLLGVPYNDKLRLSRGSHLCLRHRGWLLGSLLVLGEGEHKGKHDGDGPQDRYDPKRGV